MATTIDQKVVELRFDNKDFEKNTKQSMSTLEKLKSKLSFKGATDGLDSISKAAKKVHLNGVAEGVQTVSASFSALEIMGTTALVNLTNAAVNAGKNIVKSLTIDPVTSGWNKMNQKMSSVQTLVNSTGKSVDEIDEYLSQLMWYSDETSYSFTDMTSALANMTATGGDIDKLIPMIRGMANATAYAGKGAAEFSRIIYNLNQSYGAGALTLMDWKSVQLAGANSKQLTEELIKAGEQLGTIEKGQVTIGNFNDSLQKKWANTKVMELAFGNFDKLSKAAYDAVQRGEYDTASEAIEALSKNFDELSVKSFRAAQSAKTFKESIEATADATSTGWMKIFTAVFGNYDSQVRIFTDLANFLYDVFVSPLERIEEVTRNAFDFSGFSKMWDKLTNNPVIKTMDTIAEKVNKASRTLEEYQGIVSKVWRGDFNNVGDNPDRFDLLTKAGWDPRVVQELVNQTDRMAGYGKGWTVIDQLTIEDVTKAEKKYGIEVGTTAKQIDKQNESIKENQKNLNRLTKEQLKNLGLNDEEIRMYESLSRAADKYNTSIDKIIEKMKEASGRDLVFGRKGTDADGNEIMEVEGIFQNIAGFLGNITKAVGKAWSEVFAPFGGAELYMAISNLNEFTKRLKDMTELSDDNQNMKNLTDTFKGLFAVLKLFTTIASGGLSIVWTIFKTVLQTLGVDILDVTGFIGNLTATLVDFITKNKWVIDGITWLTKTISGGIVKVHKFVKEWLSINKVFENIKQGLGEFIKDLRKFFVGLKETDNMPKYIFDSIVSGIKKWGGKALDGISGFADAMINKLGEKLGIERQDGQGFFSYGVNIVQGLIGGIRSESGKALSGIANWAINLLDTFAKKLGIHSPSTEFFAFGQNIVQGLFNGIASLVGIVYNLISSLGGKMIEIIKDLDIGSVFVALISAGAIFGLIKLAQAINILADGLQNINGFIDQARQTMKAFEGVLKAFKVKIMTAAMKDVAVSVAILVASIWLLTTLDVGKVWVSIGAIVALVAIMGALVMAAGKFGKGQALEFGKLALTILAVGIAMSLMASALKKIASIKDISWQAMVSFGLMITALIGIAYLAGVNKESLLKLGGTLLAVGAALYLMSMVVKKLGKMNPTQLAQGILALAAFEAMIIGLIAATKLLTRSTNVSAIGPALMSIGVTFYLMATVVKKLGKMDPAQLIQGTLALAAFEAMIIGLMAATKLLTGSRNIAAIGKTLLSVGTAIFLMSLSTKILGKMKIGDIIKGEIAVAAFVGMVIGLIYAIKKIGGKDIESINKTLLGVAALIGVMTLATALLGMMKVENLVKGLVAVGVMTLFITQLIKSTEKARNIGKTLWPLVAAIGVMALAIGLLSIISPERLIAPTLALGLLMSTFGLMAKLSKDISSSGKDIAKNLGIMIGVVVVLAGAIALLSLLNPNSVLSSATSIGVLLLAMTGSLLVLSKMKINPKDLAIGVAGLLAVVLALFPLIAALKMLKGMENAGGTILALSVLIGMLTVMLLGIAVTGAIYAATGGLGLLGLVGLYAILPALLGVIGLLALMNSIPDAERNVLLLTSLLGVMVGMLLVIGTVGVLAIAGVAALYGLLAIMPPLLLFCTGLGALVTYLPMLEQFMNKGLGILIALAGGLGEMLGAFISGALTQLSAGLPAIGLNLSQFMINTTPFIVGMKLVNGQTLAGVAILTAAILALTAADFINGIFSFLSGGDSFSRMGTELSKFAINALPFMVTMSTIPTSAMNGIKALAGAVLTLTAANLLDGLSRFFGGGGSSLASFGEQLPPLGTSLAGFVSNLGTFGDDQIKTTECAGNAIVALSDAAKKLPKEGGWAQKIFGSTNLAGFAEQMPVVAGGVVGFVNALGEFSEPQIATAEAACKVITAVANAADALPSTGGFWQKLFGDKGDGLTKFADNMPKVGKGVKGFINELDSVKDKVGVADAGAKIIESIAKLSDLDLNKAGNSLPGFGDKMKEFGTKVKSFIDNFKSVKSEDVNTVNGNLTIVTEAVKKLMTTISDTQNANADTVITTMEDIGKRAAKALNSESIKTELTTQGKNFVSGFSKAITNNEGIVTTAVDNMVSKALAQIPKTQNSNSPSKETFKYGEDFGDGYIMAISSYASKAYSVSANVGEEAKKGLTSSVLKMSSLVDADMDSNPVIRPVLDLSEVSNGATKINSLLGNPSLQTKANLNYISSGMKNRNQNGNEIVSAIDGLRSSLGNTGNTYIIDGVSYADTDKDISNAIGVLIRAANVERRT